MAPSDQSIPANPSRSTTSLARELAYLALPIVVVTLLFAPALFGEKQLVFRDAGHFYYPYFQLQVDQWQKGHIPLWNPHENGGEPLAGNPTASLFYPGKAIFAFLPYAIAYKLYLVGHVWWAALAMYFAGRRHGLDAPSASLASLAYAGSGFILFQVYNIVFLVGAAWLPIGMYLVQRLIDKPTLRRAAGLALVLAMQILGGDPQVAQVTLVLAIPYLIFRHLPLFRAILLCLGFVGLGLGITSFARPIREILRTLWSSPTWADGLSSLWPTNDAFSTATIARLVFSIMGVLVLLIGWVRWRQRDLGKSLTMLIVAAVLSIGLSAIQILPTLEFTSLSGRASPDVPAETVAFSLHPARLAETVWSASWGSMLPQNSRWFPWAQAERSIWVPNLYAGLIPLLLAITAMRLVKGVGIERWLTYVTLVSLFWAFGKFGDFRWIWDSEAFAAIHPLEIERGTRLHGDAAGLYWLAEETIPGFKQFRYPSKLLVFVSWGLALLAGQGLARLIHDPFDRRTWRLAGIASAILLFAPIAAALASTPLREFIQKHSAPASSYGPFQVELAMSQLLISLISAMTIMGLFLLILIVGRLRPRSFAYAAPCLVGLTMIDLLTAHRAICLTAPQAELDAIPAAIEKIRSYHQAKYPDEFFRVHRTRLYEPIKFFRSSSADRVAEQVLWERMTAQPKYGVPLGIDYAKTEGTMNLYDIDFFFAPWVVRAPAALRASSTRPLDQVVYYPRVGYDLWNTRYFILPKQSILDDIERGSLTLLTNKRGEPLPLVASWPADEEDCLILENPDAMPRSWIVHEVEILSPIDHLRRVPRSERMERLLYRSLDAGLPLWEGTPFGDYPIDRRAMVESDDLDIVTQLDQLRPLSTNDPSSESIRIEDYQPDRVEIAAELTSNGLVVLADAFYPGWQATVDDKPAPILRTNRAMRGILVPAGKHRVIMYYQASYFWPGLVISAGSMLTSIILLVWGREANRE